MMWWPPNSMVWGQFYHRVLPKKFSVAMQCCRRDDITLAWCHHVAFRGVWEWGLPKMWGGVSWKTGGLPHPQVGNGIPTTFLISWKQRQGRRESWNSLQLARRTSGCIFLKRQETKETSGFIWVGKGGSVFYSATSTFRQEKATCMQENPKDLCDGCFITHLCGNELLRLMNLPTVLGRWSLC